ncbi:hypothetical protein BD289DRAFT_142079 [Coniella lustricola]|uniref:Alpha and gamma adaptin binding protein p34-domain-containing protein n=1 Tax=Coniella lustricola TaxID=2025994 RepID=A0A2T2ZVD6_9PEZI|nr:hypothetical protein BD289DRAFT_142079 [Coniella lustricola]
MAKPETISNPRRILAVALGAETEQLSQVVRDLTGNVPQPVDATLAGTTHDFALNTVYYTATVPLWLDLISDPEEWSATFLSDEAKEVLQVLGGLLVVFAMPKDASSTAAAAAAKDGTQQTKTMIAEVGKVIREGLGGWEWDGVTLAVGVGPVDHPDDLDVWDEVCGDAGLEFVHVVSAEDSTETRNEFGEKTGIPRVLEALQSSDWASVLSPGDDVDDDGENINLGDGDNDEADLDLDLENMDFGIDREDFDGLKKAIWEAQLEREGLTGSQEEVPGGTSIITPTNPSPPPSERTESDQHLDDDDINKIEQMMHKLQAVRDMSAGLPEEQRKRLAARAVGEVMRDL